MGRDRHKLQNKQHQHLRLRPYDTWTQSAIVFSPHQDDETLGCGGTIIQKCRAGAKVQIVYLTDGSAANGHLGLIEPAQLSQIREQEAIAAAQDLGVPASQIQFLRYPDGCLHQHRVSAIQRVAEILRSQQPQEIFIPYYLEPQFIPDHPTTYQIVTAALHQSGIRTVVYQYPIWFWYHYPWVDRFHDPVFPQLRGWARLWTYLEEFWKAQYWGYRLRRDFNCAVEVADCLELKRQALYRHVSQMTQFFPDDRWKTVADVADGEFLAHCFQNDEIFCRSHH
jgi:LmbE family N-acetylglucosaminyl deacetylase